MLQWFRRKLRSPESAAQTTAAPQPPESLTEEPTEPAAPARKKRRRGTRGGRSRAKPATTAPAAKRPVRDSGPGEGVRGNREVPRDGRGLGAKPPRPRRRPVVKRPPLPAAKRELLVSVDVSEQRVAVLEDDRVAEVYLERAERRSIAGNIYKGTVDNVLPGMEAAFVQIGLEKNGFLYVDEIVMPELEGRGQGRKIQDLLSRGQELLVQAVKDPMKSKGARLTTELSLPGRFVVFQPYGEGIGVSRRLDDDERARLRDILKAIQPARGGVIVRTAAEGASADDIERDLIFLQRLWKSIDARAKQVKPPALLYQEAELPLRVVRDMFTGDFERALVDHERTLKRIVGYLKKTSPHLVERVQRYRDKQPLFEAFGVEGEIRSTLSRRVDLPSGGYLVFDYAEAFTVIDVNTGRFVGSRSKGGAARLEDTITKNNLEAVKEVVRQLRLRDIGGIIVIDFIDMANPKNRATVEEALKTELERDRTKTFVVEISPLGLVEMTRQNVTEGPREILARRCPTCDGDGIVVSDATIAVEAERRLRALAASKPRTKAFRVELNARVANQLIGPGARRLAEIEALAKRRFLLEGRDEVPLDHFVVLAEGTLEELAPEAPVDEGVELELKLVEVGLYDSGAGVAKVDGYSVCVGSAGKLVGKKVKVRVERVLNGTAYASLAGAAADDEQPITAESEAEKPTRQPRKKEAAPEDRAEAETEAETETETETAPATPKRRRRGTRGGRRRRKQPAVEATGASDGGAPADDESRAPRIHVPEPDLGAAEEVVAEGAENGDEPSKPKRKTRRGTRGGRNRRRRKGPAEAAEPAAAD